MRWTLDTAHAEVEFAAKHLMISTVKGRFKVFDGDGTTDAQGHLQSVRMEIDAASIDTNTADRDKHLRSPDFLDTDKFPKITFDSTKVTQDGDEVTIEGNLTIRGVTKPITLKGEYMAPAKDPWGKERAALSVSGKVNRKDWGLTWNVALETGGVLVSEEIKVRIEVEAVAAEAAAA